MLRSAQWFLTLLMLVATATVSADDAQFPAPKASSDAEVLTSLDLLLSIDRVHFYSQNLADF